ncbi:hypothetical protein [Streptantibioticus ferralitis]|uniref:Uncharacterized protein n=1 Tax=Streptantibioticus ferralitis TaxID=236510 RepID=A0ABT5Z3D5_9ACTN|nr:hypothetical protein [Streptantibioticus ferralitis]MDF2258334.1 hypothetical protein [Streptantibioticus ferralitis]
MLGVDFEARPGLLQHLRDVPLGHTLLNPSRQDLRCRAGLARAGVEVDRLVGGEEEHPGLLKAVLDLGGEVGAPGDPLDGLADHHIEAAVRASCLVQQVLDASVPRDRDLELLVRMATASGGQVHAAGFDVVEVCDDHGIVGEHLLAVAQLARQGQGWVLLVVCGGAPRKRDEDQLVLGVHLWLCRAVPPA